MVKKLFIILLLLGCINAYTQVVSEDTPSSKIIALIKPNIPEYPATSDLNQMKNIISILIDNIDNVGDNIGEVIAFITSRRQKYIFDFFLSQKLLKSKNPVLIAYFLYKTTIITEELYFSDEALKVFLEFSQYEGKESASDETNKKIEQMDEYDILVLIKTLDETNDTKDPTRYTDLAQALINKYGTRIESRTSIMGLTHAILTGDPSKIVTALQKYTNIFIVDPQELIRKYNLYQITCPQECSVYFYMGHGRAAGEYISKKHKNKMFYSTATGCELNAKQGRIDASIMEEYMPGFPPQFWSNGIREAKANEKGINPYYNAGYDPMFSLVLKPHKFQEEEYNDFLIKHNSTTPLASNWGNYCHNYVTNEFNVIQEKDISNTVINAVGFMRMLQQVWMASIDKAITLTASCEDCDGVKVEFYYGFYSKEFSAYEQRYSKATSTALLSDKESLDYKILVSGENINDKEMIALPSGKTVIVPDGYIENLKREYPINYEKNLKPDGSIKFKPIICDESISLESVPDLPPKNELGGNDHVIIYTITKKNAENILKSECRKFFTVNKN